jgi:hypothetical protein
VRRGAPVNGLLCVTALALLAAAASAQAPETPAPVQPALIKGQVLDAETGEVLPYTNVYIAGTSIGTIALQDGKFFLGGLRPGTYTVRASYISYALGSETVTVSSGEVAEIEFLLDVEAIYTDPIEVSAERKLIEIELTGSVHRLTADEMEAMPLDNIVEMIAHQPGVTLQDNEIHIRGGRADDTQFIVDGISVNDPLAGGGYGYAIDPSIINEIEVLTGGFNAEYGQAVSGVVNVSTKEGGDRVSGKVSWKRDHFLGRADGFGFDAAAALALPPVSMALGEEADVAAEPDYRELDDFDRPQNIDVVKASVSGPDPISGLLDAVGLGLPGTRYFLLSGSMDIRDGYLPIYSRALDLETPLYDAHWLSPREENDWNGLAKWTWNINPRHKINVNLTRQLAISQGFHLPGEGYPREFIDGLDNALVFTNENILSQLYYRWVMGEKDFFEISLGRNFSRMHANLIGNDDFTTYPVYDSPPGPANLAVGSSDRWHDHFAESWTLKSSYAWVASETNQLKTGLELSFTEMQLVDLSRNCSIPPSGKLAFNEDIFKVHPVVGAAYFQDTINYAGMVVNAGLRLDAWAPGKEVEAVMDRNDEYLFITPEMKEEFYDSTVEFWLRSWKLRASPRLGVSFPVTEKDKFFFNYGHFSQWPRYAYVYPQLQAQTASEIQLLGNPNLDPKITVEYETGIQHEFPGLWSVGVTFFNRDIFGYAKSVRMNTVDIGAADTPDPNDEGTVTIEPVRYFNGDSARSLGVEISVIKRTTKFLSGSASLELSSSTGTNSNADQGYLETIYEGSSSTPTNAGGLARTPLLWDKPWRVSVNLDFSVFEKERPRLFGWTMPANWSLNLLFSAESGQRYTPREFRDPAHPANGDWVDGDYNSDLGPYKSTLNLRFNKYWNLSRKQRVTFFVEARNVLNHKNYRRVNRWTGDGYQVGDYNPEWEYDYGDWYLDDEGMGPILTTDSEEYAKGRVNPSYVENPRVILMGVSYSW